MLKPGCDRELHQSMEPEHVVLSLLKDGEGIAQALIKKLGVDVPNLVSRLEECCARFPRVEGSSFQVYLSNDLKQIIDRASEQAGQLKDEFLSAEHILLAISQNAKTSAGQLFKEQGIRHENLLQALMALRGNQRVTDQNPEAKYQVLEKYCIDLTQKARSGKLDPVIGRDTEIRRVIQVLFPQNQKTIRYSSASPVSVKPQLSKGWHSASFMAMCPKD